MHKTTNGNWKGNLCRRMLYFFFPSRRRHTICSRDWSSDVCSSDLATQKNRFLLRCSKQIAGLKAQAKRRARDFGNEDIALCEPLHVARKNLLRRHAAVRAPRDRKSVV